MLIASPLASRIRDTATRTRVTTRAVRALHARGHVDVTTVEAGLPDEVAAAAAEAVRDGATLVALAGGDGTIRDAGGALSDSGVDVGIVPCGTGNLYAVAVGVPRTIEDALGALRDGVARPFDIASVRLLAPDGTAPAARLLAQPRSFGVACGTGFDARLIAATSREMKQRYGVAAYFLAASRLLPTLAPRPTVIVVDGVRTELESVVVLVVNCGDVFQGVLRPKLPAEPDDGLLHVLVLPRGGIVSGIRGVVELMNAHSPGLSPSGHAARLVGREVRVEVTPACPTQVDGDPFPAAWLEARIQPGALRIVRRDGGT